MQGGLTREDRRRLIVKRTLEVVGWLAAILIFAFATHSALAREAHAQGTGSPPAHSRARRAADLEEVTPASIVRAARAIYVCPSEHVDAKYLEYKLLKKPEFRDWKLLIVEDGRRADLVLKIEKTALNYIFRLVDPETSVVAASGKVVAINKLVAAEYLGTEIVKKLKEARAAAADDERPARTKKRRAKDAEEDEDEWSES
jgi:hypothetical protein